jgi:hypothetical protein
MYLVQIAGLSTLSVRGTKHLGFDSEVGILRHWVLGKTCNEIHLVLLACVYALSLQGTGRQH